MFLYYASSVKNQIIWHMTIYDFEQIQALTFNEAQGSSMLYGVGYDEADTENPYNFFSIDNSDPTETNGLKYFSMSLDDGTITALLSSDTAANDFFFVTEANINYFQAPEENFRRNY